MTDPRRKDGVMAIWPETTFLRRRQNDRRNPDERGAARVPTKRSATRWLSTFNLTEQIENVLNNWTCPGKYVYIYLYTEIMVICEVKSIRFVTFNNHVVVVAYPFGSCRRLLICTTKTSDASRFPFVSFPRGNRNRVLFWQCQCL